MIINIKKKENKSMKTEYELRVLEIDKEKIIKKLESLGATKIGDFDQKRYIYDLKPAENGKWIRLRTNGTTTTLTYKDIESNTIDGTKEVEFEVENIQKANEFLEKIGFKSRNYQENKRTQYMLNGTEIDIDTWPMIPTYLEVEGKSKKEVLNMLKTLEVDESKITALNCDDIYRDIYNIEILKIEKLKF